MNRRRLPDRRHSVNFTFEHTFGSSIQKFNATAGYYDGDDGSFGGGPVGEIFINSAKKSGSEADINASAAATQTSLALQYGCPLDVARRAMPRNPDGSPQDPVGHALDIIAEMDKV